LSNELFLEIFDYLDGYDTYDAFLTLNTRFQHLICSCLLLKINRNQCWRIIFSNRHSILSLCLSNESTNDEFFKTGVIDSSFHCLESLVLNGIDSDKVISLLINLGSLPRLFSLVINIYDALVDPMAMAIYWYMIPESEPANQARLDLFMEIYRLVFRLPVLKYNKISSGVQETLTSLPPTLSEEFSSIEHLVINHPCTLNMLIAMLSLHLDFVVLVVENYAVLIKASKQWRR
jgi:hypothetical protein